MAGDADDSARRKGKPPRDPLLGALGERIRAARESAGMKQDEVAKAAGISQSFVWRMEAGQQNLSVRNLSRVALALGATMSSLLDGMEADPGTLGTREFRWKAGKDMRPKPAGRVAAKDG